MISIDMLRDFFVKNRLVKGNQIIDENESLIQSGIIDSLGILELTSYITKNFNIIIDENDLVPENFDTLNSIKAYLESKALS